MKFIRVSADMRESNRHLDRIATALELILELQYGYKVSEAHIDQSGDEPTVEYSGDESTLKNEIEEWVRGNKSV